MTASLKLANKIADKASALTGPSSWLATLSLYSVSFNANSNCGLAIRKLFSAECSIIGAGVRAWGGTGGGRPIGSGYPLRFSVESTLCIKPVHPSTTIYRPKEGWSMVVPLELATQDPLYFCMRRLEPKVEISIAPSRNFVIIIVSILKERESIHVHVEYSEM